MWEIDLLNITHRLLVKTVFSVEFSSFAEAFKILNRSGDGVSALILIVLSTRLFALENETKKLINLWFPTVEIDTVILFVFWFFPCSFSLKFLFNCDVSLRLMFDCPERIQLWINVLKIVSVFVFWNGLVIIRVCFTDGRLNDFLFCFSFYMPRNSIRYSNSFITIWILEALTAKSDILKYLKIGD